MAPYRKKEIGNRVVLQQYGSCPNWKLGLVGKTAEVLDTEHDRVLVEGEGNVHWPLDATTLKE